MQQSQSRDFVAAGEEDLLEIGKPCSAAWQWGAAFSPLPFPAVHCRCDLERAAPVARMGSYSSLAPYTTIHQ